MYNTIKENASYEIVEKKSKFIGNVFYVETREEAENIIKEQKKKYHDARHNCYAYRVFENDSIIEKSSDDGEPSGTAGAPMLNILVIVTRYFGGILLGTGGLVKAYSEATKLALKEAKITKLDTGFIYNIEINYSDLENLKYFLKNNEINILKEEFFENVKLCVFVPKNKMDCFKFEKTNILKIEKDEKNHTKRC